MKKDYPFYKNDPVDSIVQIIKRSAKLYADSVALRFKQNKQVKQKTYIELADDCCINAQKFLGLNLRIGHIAIIGTSSYEWLAAYFGAVFAGMVAVPLDKELSPETVYDMMTIEDVQDILAIDLIGAVPDDENIVISTNQGEPLVGSDNLAGQAYMNICRRIVGEEVPFLDLNGKKGVISKLTGLFRKN